MQARANHIVTGDKVHIYPTKRYNQRADFSGEFTGNKITAIVDGEFVETVDVPASDSHRWSDTEISTTGRPGCYVVVPNRELIAIEAERLAIKYRLPIQDNLDLACSYAYQQGS